MDWSHLVAPHLARLAAVAVQDLKARYQLACFVREARAYSGSVELIANALDVDVSALRRYAHTSAVIAPAEFAAVLALRTPRGMPLTWSQLEVLAREPDGPLRRMLARSAARDGLSVRDLQQLRVTHASLRRPAVGKTRAATRRTPAPRRRGSSKVASQRRSLSA